jgi:hypothetical protein
MSETEPPIIEDEKVCVCPRCAEREKQTCYKMLETAGVVALDLCNKTNDSLSGYFSHTRNRKISYCQHLTNCMWYSCKLVMASVGLLVHGLYPDILTTTAGDIVISVSNSIQEERKNTN